MARSVARVGACADELRLMGVERDWVPADVGRAGGGEGSIKENRLEYVRHPRWSECGEVHGGTVRTGQCNSWREVNVYGSVIVP